MRTVGLVTANERETDSFSVEACVEGRDADVEKIVEMLVTAPPEAAKISVISIWGMGGLGKTTVARKVFNQDKIKDHFGLKMWVYVGVSTSFDSLSLYKLILGTLNQEYVNATREIVLQKLKQHLEGKRYLLVLDDVWGVSTGGWDEFENTLSNISSDKGNCIVVTTRNQSVASHVGTLAPYQLSRLSKFQCWSIIKAKTFGKMNAPEYFETTGECIAERCDGLPLAAKVIGGLLRGKLEEDYWGTILENRLFDGDGDDGKIKKILKLSYDNLPKLSLKKCFSYCFIFPKGCSFRRQETVELWMAEGFLQDGQGGDMESTGHKNFNHLLQCSLFQDANRDKFGDIVACKMHDLVHDLACSITEDTNQVRYRALTSADAKKSNTISQMKYLRTVFFEGKLANNMFSNFRCLHVLKLTGREIKELPSGIEKLIHLRSLDIESTEVERLRDSIGKLYHLQSLLTSQVKLPNTIINLVSLRHLHVSAGTELPPLVGKLTSLRTLKHYKVRDENGWRIEELGKLKNLKGELNIKNLEMVKDKKEAEFADLSGKPGIFKLTLKWNESSDRVGDHTNVLEGLQPHGYLKSLEIIGYKGKTLPSWTMSMAIPACNNNGIQAFNSLVEIQLIGFTQCEELPTLGHLRHLRFLVLKNWPKLQSVVHSFYRIENLSVPEILFPALERLEISSMPELTEWLEMKATTTVFPCLKYLDIGNCPKLKIVYCHFPCLEVIEVAISDLSLTNLFSNTSSLQYLRIRSLSGLDSLPDEFFVKNQNLTDLIINDCPKLMRLVPSSLGGGGSLKRLVIWWCENLTELPDDLNTLCKLEELRIIGCRGLKSIPFGLLESCISSLQYLKLWCLRNLETLDTLIPCLGKMSRLKDMMIIEIPKFKMIPAEIGCLGSLRSLAIGGFSEPMNEDQLTSIVQKCPSLRSLELYREEQHYDTLIEMDSVQHLSVG